MTRSPGLTPLLDDPERADALADLHVAERDLVVGADHRHAVEILQFLHGALRHQQGAGVGVEQQPRAAVLTGPQQQIRIGEFELNAQGAGRRVDRALDQVDAAGLRVDAAVGERQLDAAGARRIALGPLASAAPNIAGNRPPWPPPERESD